MAKGFRTSERLKENLRRLIKEYPKEAAKALFIEAGAIQKVSMSRTPVKVGTLKGSHETSKPTTEGGTIKVTIKVGGPAAPYAAAVHFRPARHTVGQDRFLESAFNDAVPKLQAALAERIKKAIHARMKRR